MDNANHAQSENEPCHCIECNGDHCAPTATCEFECCNGHDSLDEMVKVKPISRNELVDIINQGVRSILGVR